jgi:hypothetical protein
MISEIIAQYTISLKNALQLFLNQYNTFFHKTLINDDVDFFHNSVNDEHVDTTRNSISVYSANSQQNENNSEDSKHSLFSKEFSTYYTKNDKKNLDENSQELQFKQSELNEVRNSWIMLIKQGIQDIQFLETSEQKCLSKIINISTVNHHHHHHHSSKHSSPSKHLLLEKEKSLNSKAITKESINKKILATEVNHAKDFSNEVLKLFTMHCDVLQSHRLNCLLKSWFDKLPRILALCEIKRVSQQIKTVSTTATNQYGRNSINIQNKSVESLSSLYGNTASAGSDIKMDLKKDRNVLNKHIALSTKYFDLLIEKCLSTYTDVCKDIKAILDIYDNQTTTNISDILTFLTLKFFYLMMDKIDKLCEIQNNFCVYNAADNNLTYYYSLATNNANNNNDVDNDDDVVITELQHDSKVEDSDFILNTNYIHYILIENGYEVLLGFSFIAIYFFFLLFLKIYYF